MSSFPNKSIGQKLDEVLDPFLADRSRLRAQLKDQKARRAELDTQIKETERDLAVVDQGMIHALRDAARQEPLLSAAFNMRSADPAPAAIRPTDSNPLLNPVGVKAG